MITRRNARYATRAFVATAFVALLTVSGAAMADTPAAWDDAPNQGFFDYLLILVLIPAGIALVVSLLAVLPSLVKGEKHEPGDSWRSDDEWFGGPRKGIDAPDTDSDNAAKGGASGNW